MDTNSIIVLVVTGLILAFMWGFIIGREYEVERWLRAARFKRLIKVKDKLYEIEYFKSVM